MKTIAVLGSTGSIGRNVLKIAQHLGQEELEIGALAARSNIDLLYEQALTFKPKLIAVYDKDAALTLSKKLPHIRVVGGMEGVEEAASLSDADLVVNALVGSQGLRPTLAAIKAKKDIALANKEVLVCAGEYVTQACRAHQTRLIPIDSEHSAIFQCLENKKPEDIQRIILTASGGPFLNYNDQKLKAITPQHALKHPNWDMGAKVTIDCSTLMNKGLEVIEAHWLFETPLDQIEVVVHPQSIIHSMVEFIDNSILAQMGLPDMIVPIQHALTYPKKSPGLLSPFDFTKHSQLEFIAPNYDKFICLKLAFESQRLGGSYPCFLNAANEILVKRFLNQKISWLEIGQKLEQLMERHQRESMESVSQILHIDHLARKEAEII